VESYFISVIREMLVDVVTIHGIQKKAGYEWIMEFFLEFLLILYWNHNMDTFTYYFTKPRVIGVLIK